MRRVILLFAAVLLASIGWSQTMNIHYKNGQTVQYNMNNIDYVEYTENNPNNAQVSSGEAVDLGLSVLWANCNVGANSPEQYGDKYAWAETSPKEKYNKSNYLYYDSNTESYIDIGMDIKGTDYDVAHVKWGGDWRMPTYAELEELEYKCEWKWGQYNGVNGYVVTGSNSNSIFIPVGTNDICFWASEIALPFNEGLNGTYFRAAHIVIRSGQKPGGWGGPRENGNYIRPVMPK